MYTNNRNKTNVNLIKLINVYNLHLQVRKRTENLFYLTGTYTSLLLFKMLPLNSITTNLKNIFIFYFTTKK